LLCVLSSLFMFLNCLGPSPTIFHCCAPLGGHNLLFCHVFSGGAQKGTGLRGVKFLQEAVESIIRCRRVLAYTYVYAYYLVAAPDNKWRVLFENHQQRLEKLTDQLQGLAERPLEELAVDDKIRQQAMALTRTVEKFRKAVLSTIEQASY